MQILILGLLLLGMLNSRHISRAAGMVAYGFFVSVFYFIFFPLIIMGNMKLLDPALPSFPNGSLLPQAILLIYLLEMYAVFLILAKGRKQRIRRSRMLLSREVMIYWITILLYFALQLNVLFGSGLLEGGHWYRTKGLWLSQGGSISVAITFAIWGARVLIVAYTFELLRLRRIGKMAAILVVISICTYELLFVGNRIVVFMFGIAGFLFIYRHYGKRLLALTILILIPIMLAMGIYQDARHLLFTEGYPTALVRSISSILARGELSNAAAKVFESADLLIMLDMFAEVGDRIAPLKGSSFAKSLLWVIPRSVWENKPQPVTVEVGNIYLAGEGISLVPLFFGEIHFNFGMLGLAIFPILFWIMLAGFEALSQRIRLNAYVQFILGFLAFRLPFSDMVIIAIATSLIYSSLSFLRGVLRKKRLRAIDLPTRP